jgi:cytochrome c oxidase cbb3-type subunit 3
MGVDPLLVADFWAGQAGGDGDDRFIKSSLIRGAHRMKDPARRWRRLPTPGLATRAGRELRWVSYQHRLFPCRKAAALETGDPVFGDEPPWTGSPAPWVFLGLLGLVFAGGVAYALLRKPAPPPPEAVMKDPLLLEGRNIYVSRCATCHGMEGRGDGPIAVHLLGPPVGNISDGKWKHGDQPRDVYSVIAKGVGGTRMAGWESALEPSQLRAVTAYVYYLAGQDVPGELRHAGP